MRSPSSNPEPWPILFVLDMEKPQDYVYDPEITNRWYWTTSTSNENAYYVENND